MIRARIEGAQLQGMGAEILERLRPRAEAAVKESLLLLEGTVKQKLSTPGTGRWYRSAPSGFSRVPGRKFRGAMHRASSPGDPPAVDTGRLRASITHEGPMWNGDTIEGRVGTNVEYASWLEYGTSRMDKRPYLRPALEEAEPAIRRRLEAL